jgi:hypothetical protein
VGNIFEVPSEVARVAAVRSCGDAEDFVRLVADRTALLFPEEDRFICKVETEPRLYGDVAVRVASAM